MTVHRHIRRKTKRQYAEKSVSIDWETLNCFETSVRFLSLVPSSHHKLATALHYFLTKYRILLFQTPLQ